MKKGKEIILINYANDAYRESQKFNTWTGKHIARFKKVIEYGPNDIDKKFYDENKEILDIKRGNGLWLWKPYFIYKTLKELDDGDIVFYCDSGACFFRSVKPILKILNKQDIWVSMLPLIEKQFTKEKTFELMNMNDEKYKNSNQISATFIAVKKTKFSIEFVKEWLNYCCNFDIISAQENLKTSYGGFYSHREDQSVLSLLIKKHNIKAYSDPSQYGKLPEKYKKDIFIMNYYMKKDYPICIIHHRTKDANKKEIFKQLLCAILPHFITLKYLRKKRNI